MAHAKRCFTIFALSKPVNEHLIEYVLGLRTQLTLRFGAAMTIILIL